MDAITDSYAQPLHNMSRSNFSLSCDVIPAENLMSIIVYSVLLAIAGAGNLTVFITLYKSRRRRSSRVSLFIMHLCIADLWVTFIVMPMEIGWHATVCWTAGDVMCRAMMFCRAFGFYLSSFILIAISADRYCAISRPLSLNDSNYRGKIMLSTAWIVSIVASTPQVGTLRLPVFLAV